MLLNIDCSKHQLRQSECKSFSPNKCIISIIFAYVTLRVTCKLLYHIPKSGEHEHVMVDCKYDISVVIAYQVQRCQVSISVSSEKLYTMGQDRTRRSGITTHLRSLDSLGLKIIEILIKLHVIENFITFFNHQTISRLSKGLCIRELCRYIWYSRYFQITPDLGNGYINSRPVVGG